ncbi:MAG TPA: hypothetical protein VLT47_15860 [Anaeromyxobacteraceae bacterium]|nr:hypothetical protein [Anaeromyxobacteraceae bacterium]
MTLDPLLFGDNQFFGVNHRSEEKARQQLERFRDTAAIIDVLDAAYDMGVRTFMCTTHDRIGEICDHMRAHPARYADFVYLPCMPYAHKYANSVGQVGMIETVKRFAGHDLLGTLYLGALGTVTRDVYRLMRLLVDAEMRRFHGLNTPVVFLQNVVTDLLLGMRLYDAFAEFHAYVARRYGAEAGFITMNLPALLEALERAGIRDPIVCANVNKIGFRMSGGVDAYRAALASGRCRAIAMSVFASGAIPPQEAIEWVCGLQGVQSIVFGASSAANIRSTQALVDAAWGRDPSRRRRPAAGA